MWILAFFKGISLNGALLSVVYSKYACSIYIRHSGECSQSLFINNKGSLETSK